MNLKIKIKNCSFSGFLSIKLHDQFSSPVLINLPEYFKRKKCTNVLKSLTRSLDSCWRSAVQRKPLTTFQITSICLGSALTRTRYISISILNVYRRIKWAVWKSCIIRQNMAKLVLHIISPIYNGSSIFKSMKKNQCFSPKPRMRTKVTERKIPWSRGQSVKWKEG